MSPTPLARTDLSSVLALVQNTPLESSSLDAKPLTAPLERQRTLALDRLPPLTVDVRTGLQISMYNSPDDRDQDGILLPPLKDAFGDVMPAVTLSSERAWLKYRTEGVFSASGDLLGGDHRATPGIGGNSSAALTDYRIHDRSEKLVDAIRADLKDGTRLASVLDDVESLSPGEAVSVQFGGTLKLAIKVSWADMFAGELGALAAVTQTRQLIALEFDAGATLTAQIAVSDDFTVVFSRVDERTWRVGARKADKRTSSAGLSAGIDVSLDQHSAAAVVDTVLGRVLDEAVSKVRPLLQKGSLAALDQPGAAVIVRLMHRFGLDEKVASFTDVTARVDDLERKISSTIEGVVRTKLAAAFSYEYRRATSTADIFQATLSAGGLRAHHPALVRGDLQPAIAAILANEPGIVLDRYLHEKSVERTHTWGFTLGIGKWISIGGTDTRTIAPVIRFDIDGRRQESYLGLRSYDGKGIAGETSWSGEFNAEMDACSREPRLTEFGLGIHLLWRQQPKHLSEDDIDVFLDSAVIWGAMTPNDAADLRPMLVGYKGRSCDATVQIVVADTSGQPTLRRTLAGMASAPAITAALGEAMPWRAGSIGRTQAAVRRNLYGPLWEAYFKSPDTPPSSLATSANVFLTEQQYPDLGRLELQFLDLRPYTFAGLSELNTDTPASAQGFVSALGALRHALDANESCQPTLGQVFRGLSGFWAQSLHIRAAGVYLLQAARVAGVFADVKRAATFEVDGRAIVLG